jgi:hypothetical protein
LCPLAIWIIAIALFLLLKIMAMTMGRAAAAGRLPYGSHWHNRGAQHNNE